MTKKRFLLALALMLTAVGGAWAQDSPTVYSSSVALTDLQVGDVLIDGFSITRESGQFIQVRGYRRDGGSAVTDSYSNVNNATFPGGVTIRGNASNYNYTPYADGQDANAWIVSDVDEGTYPKVYLDGYNYTAPTPGTLVEDGNNQWHLAVPAGNVTLTVDYYGQYTLDSVPTAEGWQVKVNGTLATVTPYSTGSALGHVDNINETDSVELIPPAELRGTIKAVRLTESVAAPAEPITVTINQSDWPTSGNSFTKDGVTVSAGSIDANVGNLTSGGSFSTTLGNFTSIVVTTFYCTASGTGWDTSYGSTQTWSGTPASSVSFSGSFYGMGNGITITCTIQPNN